MSKGLDELRHIVALMMENRSFDHMLGALKAEDSRINGLTGDESNLDTTNEPAKVQPLAEFQGQLDPDPDHHFPAVHKQLYFGTQGPPAPPSMQGFVQSYFEQQRDVRHSRKIMYYFDIGKLPVLHTLAREFAVFNGWFSSIPGPTLCNRAFAHYGTSFGRTDMEFFYTIEPYLSIYDRMLNAGRTAKIYYFDQESSSTELLSLLKHQPKVFGTFDQFLADCKLGELPDYCFIEPNYKDHLGEGGGDLPASDQHPDHDVQVGEVLTGQVYNAIRENPEIWKSSVLLIVYDEHGGIFDHVPPPACTPDKFAASAQETGSVPFSFDRLGVRVPAILVSPWIPAQTVVPGTEDANNGRIFEHASIPATVTKHFIGDYDQRTLREKKAETFLDLLGNEMRQDCPTFDIEE